MRQAITALVLVQCFSGCSSDIGPDPFAGAKSGQMQNVVDSSAPAQAASMFGGSLSNDNGVPSVMYPLDSTMLALNIGQLEVQWNAVEGATVYRVRVKSKALDLSFYVGVSVCKNLQCRYSVSSSDWLGFTTASAGQTAVLAVYSTNGSGNDVQRSTGINLSISPEDVKGGLYYFSTSQAGIMRLPFGASKATFFEGVGASASADDMDQCIGCHAVSRDGKKVAAEQGGGDGFLTIVDSTTASPTPTLGPSSNFRSNFSSFNPDGTLLLTNWAGQLSVIDVATGQTKFTAAQGLVGGRAVMGEWSPDGQSIVFVRLPAGGKLFPEVADLRYMSAAGDWLIADAGDIAIMPYNNGAFGTPTLLVASSNAEYNYYPSFSPDSEWVVFSTGTRIGSESLISYSSADIGGYGISRDHFVSYDQQTSRLRMVSATGGMPIELAHATRGQGLTTSWPKFAPFEQANDQLVFITFSSKANYGFEVTSGMQPQIWMAAIDLKVAAQVAQNLSVADPSYAPFWLPFQDPTTNNHETIWTEQIACSTDADCGDTGFFCEQGQCDPAPK